MREALVFEAKRSGYGIDQVADSAITVGELIDILQNYDEETLIVLSHDRGYTYGSIDIYDSHEAREFDNGWDSCNA